MADLSMYPVKGNCRFPNIMEQLANRFVLSVIVEALYFPQAWTIGIDVNEIDGQMHLVPFICYRSEHFPKLRLRYYIGIKNSKHCTTVAALPSMWHTRGLALKISDLKPEILDDGALVVEYGIQVEGLQDADKMWTFQLHYGLFDSKGKRVMMPFRNNKIEKCHPQIRAIHDNSIEIENENIGFYKPLQIAHGVRHQLCTKEAYYIAYDACAMGLRNVVQYCQWQLIQKPRTDLDVPINEFNAALVFDMRSFLVHLIREMNSKEKLMKIMKDMDIDDLSGESMKTFMKFLLFE